MSKIVLRFFCLQFNSWWNIEKYKSQPLEVLESNYKYKTQKDLIFLILRNWKWKEILQPEHNVHSKTFCILGIAILLLKTQVVREKTWANPWEVIMSIIYTTGTLYQ